MFTSISAPPCHQNNEPRYLNMFNVFTSFPCMQTVWSLSRLLLLSCPSHHFLPLARSFTVARSSAVQASSSRRQERRCAIIYGSPQSQTTHWASSRYSYLLITVFARPTPVRSRLRARQQSQSSPDPASKDSATSSPILTEA